MYYTMPKRRKIVQSNVEHLKRWLLINQKKSSYIEFQNSLLAKKIFKYNSANFFFSVSLLFNRKLIKKRYITIENEKLLRETLLNNKSSILLFAHQGPWELLSLIPEILGMDTGMNKKFASIYRPLKNPHIDKWFKSLRESHGMRLISRDDGFLMISRFLKNHGVLLAAMDIRLRQGIPALFFNKKALSSNIPYTLKKVSNAKTYVLSFKRLSILKWKISWNELDPGDGINDKIKFVESMNVALEKIISDNPVDYFFFQDRYKSYE